jgi:signal transduction histidine kinase
MSPPIQIRTHPLKFLLYLEWILLIIIAIAEVLRFPLQPIPRLPLLNLVCLGFFAVMGLRLPNSGRFHKFSYTVIEFFLILLTSFVGGLRIFSALYIILVTRSCLIFEQRTRSLISALAFTLVLITQSHRMRYYAAAGLSALSERSGVLSLSAALLMGLVLVFLQLLVNAALSEKKSREQLAIVNAQLRQYALRVEDVATLQERNRIAREIHDSLGHSLTVFNLHLEAALRLLESDPDEAKSLLVEAKQLGKTALQEVRESVSALRSDPLKEKDLGEAIAILIEDFQRSTNIIPICQLGIPRSISSEMKTTIYRIVQEALTNICKYAIATEVNIQLTVTSELTLTIQDNGRGFEPMQTTTGFGLQGMRERTLAIGGHFEIITAPTKGCCIVAKFPSC